jgi:RimJ/RimL family protein N-acetyltransferase
VTSPTRLRSLGPADAQSFQALRLQALRECPSAFASSVEEECDTPISTLAERLAATTDRCMIGAFYDAELIGMVGLQREQMRKLAHKAVVWGMYVAPGFRTRGLGRQLVGRALELAASMAGVRQVNLCVNAANAAAIALYAAMGFKSFGVERGFMLLDGEPHDEIHMVRIFEA